MAVITADLDATALTAIAIATSAVYLLFRPAGTSLKGTPPPPLRRTLSAFVLVHTLYILYCTIFARPPNVFSHFGIPLSLPAERIRALLIKRAGGDGVVLSKAVEGLLTRLASFEMRTVYVRFGQALIQDCEYCRTVDEFGLHALPRPLLQYVREAAVVGLVTTSGSYRSRWRSWGIWTLIGAALTEAYWLATVSIKITPRGDNIIYWHDVCWILRHLLFLLLPVILHFAPAYQPTSVAASIRALPVAAQQLEGVLQRAHSLRLLRAGIMRQPSLRDTAANWWARGRRAGASVRADVHVRRVADKINLGISSEGDGELRKIAQTAAEGIIRGLVPQPAPADASTQAP